MSGDSKELVAGIVDGGTHTAEQAVGEIYERYLHRILPLAQKFIGPQLQARFDAEDVAQSVFRSFVDKAREGRFTIRRSGDLWRLLAQITANKARKRVEKELADKRTPKREVHLPSTLEIANGEPAEGDAETLVEEIRTFSERLKPLERRILELRLQECTHAAISRDVNRSEATVRRILGQLGEALQRQAEA